MRFLFPSVATVLAATVVVSPAIAGGDGVGPATRDGQLWAGESPRLSVGVGLEYLNGPIVRVVQVSADEQVTEDLLTNVGLVRLSGQWSPSSRLAVGLQLPVVGASGGDPGAGGPAIGTAQISGRVALLLSGESGAWLGVTPVLGVPIGKSGRWLRDHGPSAALLVDGGVQVGRIALSASAGPEYRDVRTDGENLNPGFGIRAGLGVDATVAQQIHLGMDARTRGFGGELPIELAVYTEAALTPALSLQARVGRGIRRGPGSPALRVFAGVSYNLARSEAQDIVAIPNPEAAEEPDAIPSLVVVDVLGRPLAGAAVSDGVSEVGRTNALGRVSLRDLRRVDTATVSLPGYVTSDSAIAGRTDISMTLAYAPVAAILDVVDQLGEAVVATVRVTGGEETFDVPATDGKARFTLPPGDWTVDVTAVGYSAQSRVLVATPGRALPILSRVLLASDENGGNATIAMVVRDSAGRPVEGVEVRVDGIAYGTTGSGGVIALSGLAAGPHRIEARGERYQPVVLEAVDLSDGVNDVPVDLERVPGGLRLRVRGPDGPVNDAVVRLIGPSRLPAYPLGDNGARMFQLRPGPWSLVITSERYGLQTTQVLIDPETRAVADVDVFMQEPETGTADLTVLAVDRDGRPLSGAMVSLDGVMIGETASGGQITVPTLFTGERRLRIDGALYNSVSERIILVDGPQEHDIVVPWVDGAVKVMARTPQAVVADGVARFSGRRPVNALTLDETGDGFVQLPAGQWAVVVTSPQYGFTQRPLAVPETTGVLTIADVVFRPLDTGAANLSVTVRNPEGRPVAGASVRFDGSLAGTTDATGVFSTENIAEGSRIINVSAALLKEGVRGLSLVAGDNDTTIALSWAPGAVRVVAEGPEGVAEDAVVRFIGPEPLTPLTLGPTGERLVALSPGRWQGIASSPSFGLAQVGVEIGEEARGLRTVRFRFEPLERGAAELLVRVIDPRGRALVGATVDIGEDAPRVTGEGGAVLIRDLPIGPVNIGLNADVHYPRELTEVELRAGSQQRVIVLTPVPGTVRATIADDDGVPVNGELRFLGPDEMEPVSFEGGEVQVDLPPGAWRILAAAEGFAVASADVNIPPGAAFYDVDLVLSPARVELTDTGLVIGDAVLFDVGQSVLRSDADGVLEEVATYLLADPTLLEVQVQGHTDSTGGLAKNYALSTSRAERVVDALVDRGVPPERLSAAGFGPSQPLGSNATDEGRARNRRVQFVVKATAVGG
jgi:outer membrane protein OmpA-like peptidoglycan-associated protein